MQYAVRGYNIVQLNTKLARLLKNYSLSAKYLNLRATFRGFNLYTPTKYKFEIYSLVFMCCC